MTDIRLTPALEKALRWIDENGPAQYWPVDVLKSRQTLRRLTDAGLVLERKPRGYFGVCTYSITEDGKTVLSRA